MIPRTRRLLGAAAGLALVAGCDTSRPGAGLTNGPPPAVAPEKAPVRDDLPAPAPPAGGEVLGRTGDSHTNSGPGGRGGGTEGARPEQPATKGNSESVRATPTAVGAESPSTAAGGTKPAGNINTGTPRGPH